MRVPQRILLGPGPSTVDPRVLRAMATPLVGHLDPVFLEIMNEVMRDLRYVFGTENQLTFPMSGTGSAGMETVLVNLLNREITRSFASTASLAPACAISPSGRGPE